MSKILIFSVILCGSYFVVDRTFKYSAVSDITGWKIDPQADIKTLKKKWVWAQGETVWVIERESISQESLNDFKNCESIQEKELFKRIPELKIKTKDNGQFCYLQKSENNDVINLYLGKTFVVVHFSI